MNKYRVLLTTSLIFLTSLVGCAQTPAPMTPPTEIPQLIWQYDTGG